MKNIKRLKTIKLTILIVFIMIAGAAYRSSLRKSGTGASPEPPALISEVASGEPTGDGTPANSQTGMEAHVSEQDVVKETIFVHVCGEVKAPGVYELAYDERINDAVQMAGGFTKKAAKDSMNLALPLSDGQQIYIPGKKEAKASKQTNANAPSPQENEDPAAGDRVNLNTADKETLMTLTGIGEAKAQSILRYREERGGFQTIEDIMKITGIKEGVFNQIKDRITV